MIRVEFWSVYGTRPPKFLVVADLPSVPTEEDLLYIENRRYEISKAREWTIKPIDTSVRVYVRET